MKPKVRYWFDGRQPRMIKSKGATRGEKKETKEREASSSTLLQDDAHEAGAFSGGNVHDLRGVEHGRVPGRWNDMDEYKEATLKSSSPTARPCRDNNAPTTPSSLFLVNQYNICLESNLIISTHCCRIPLAGVALVPRVAK